MARNRTLTQFFRPSGDAFDFLENAMDATQTIVRNKLRVNPLAACLVFPLALGDLACGIVAAATLPADIGCQTGDPLVARSQTL